MNTLFTRDVITKRSTSSLKHTGNFWDFQLWKQTLFLQKSKLKLNKLNKTLKYLKALESFPERNKNVLKNISKKLPIKIKKSIKIIKRLFESIREKYKNLFYSENLLKL